MAVPSFEELFNQQQQGGLGDASGWPLGAGEMPPQQPPLQQPPAYPQQLAQMAPPPAPTGGLGNFNDALASRSNTMIGMGLGMMGGGWAGGAKGFAAGAPVDERMAAAKLAQQQHAAALAQNEAHFQRSQALAEAPQVVHVKGLFGDEIMLRDPRSGKLTPYSGGGAGGVAGSDEGTYDEKGFDRGYLDAVRKKYGSEIAKSVETMAAGRMPASGFGTMKQLIPLASRYNQNFNPADYVLHLAAEKSFIPGGRNADKVRAINQAIEHASGAWDISEKLGGVPIGGTVGGILNRGYQEYQQMTSPEHAGNVAEYGRLATGLANEMIAAAKGGSGSDVKMAHEAVDALNSAKSPAERQAAIRGSLRFLQGAHHALEQSREAGRRSGFEMSPLLSEENQARIDRIAPAASGGTAAAGSGAQPVAGQTGAPSQQPPAAAAPGMKWQHNADFTKWRQVPQ